MSLSFPSLPPIPSSSSLVSPLFTFQRAFLFSLTSHRSSFHSSFSVHKPRYQYHKQFISQSPFPCLIASHFLPSFVSFSLAFSRVSLTSTSTSLHFHSGLFYHCSSLVLFPCHSPHRMTLSAPSARQIGSAQ